MLDNHARRMRAAAIEYARLGYHVFPCARGTKFPCKDTHGELNGSDNPEFVGQVWELFPGANIGWALRYHPEFFVLDVDERSGGGAWLARRPALPPTRGVLTPSRGRGGHWWLGSTGALRSITCKGLADTCGRVDIKGLQKGYVLLPPSWIRDKGEYVATGPADIAMCPEWLESEIFHSSRPKTPERRPYVARGELPSVGKRSLVVVLREMGNLGPEIRPGVWACRCPNEAQHSEKRRPFAGDTVVYEPVRPGAPGWIDCKHAHCADIMRELLA